MTDTLTFCLTFEGGLADVLTAYSRRLSLGLSTDYVLSPESFPHVTVVKFDQPPVKAPQAWQLLEPRLPKRISIRFKGLSISPGRGGDIWIHLNVVRTAELVLLQEIAAKTLKEFAPRTAIGDLWWPHVTLLHSLDGRMPTDWGIDARLLTSEDVVAVPTLGCNRTPGLLTDVLARPDL
jgi:2'-5' RNA ligase